MTNGPPLMQRAAFLALTGLNKNTLDKLVAAGSVHRLILPGFKRGLYYRSEALVLIVPPRVDLVHH